MSGPASPVFQNPITSAGATTWTGAGGSRAWDDAANWSAGVPDSGTDAVIPASAMVVIGAGPAAVRNLDVQAKAVLSVAASSLAVYGTFTLAATAVYDSGEGTTYFGATGEQSIPAATYANLKVTGGGVKFLAGHVRVLGTCDLGGGMVRLGDYDLLLARAGSSLTGFDADHFVVSDGRGRLGFSAVGSGGTVTFPIGSSPAPRDYTPATLTNTGTPDTFWAAVTDSAAPDAAPLNTAYGVRKVWAITEATRGGSRASLTVQWNAANEGEFFDRTLCAVSQLETGFWSYAPQGWAPATVAGDQRYSRTRADLTSFSAFAVRDASLPLPVELARFTADRQLNNDVILSWETAAERNVKGFEIQVNTGQGRGAGAWSALGFVPSETPNSAAPRRYRFTDGAPNKTGVRYYRLRQVDLDGPERFSPVRTVSFEGVTSPTVVAWPNPFERELTLELTTVGNGQAQVTLFDAVGRPVAGQAVPVVVGAQNLRSLLPTDLPQGAYTLRLLVDGQALRVPLVRQ